MIELEDDKDDKDEQVRLAITVLKDLSAFSKFGEEMMASTATSRKIMILLLFVCLQTKSCH